MESLAIIPTEILKPKSGQNAAPTGIEKKDHFQKHLTTAQNQQQEQSGLSDNHPMKQTVSPHSNSQSQTSDNQAITEVNSQNQFVQSLDNKVMAELNSQNQFVQPDTYPLTLDGLLITQADLFASEEEPSGISQMQDSIITVAQLFPQTNNLTETLQLQDRKTITTNMLDAITNRINGSPTSENEVITLAAQHKNSGGYFTPEGIQSLSLNVSTLTNDTVIYQKDLSVEKWSTTFSSPDWAGKSITIDSQGTKTPQALTNIIQTQPTDSQSQLITVFHSPVTSETASTVVPNPAGTNSSTNGARQDLTNQYIHSNLPNAIENEEYDPQNNSAENNEQQGKEEHLLTAQRAGHGGKGLEGSSIFSIEPQSLQAATSSSQTSGTYGLRYASGFELQENQIINQVVERFNINRRLETGTITLRLQPAELGNLKLEIWVKRDSISAHIVAANPQVQDILERNIPKLREALAQQGLQLEQLEVTVAASDKDNSQLFKDQTRNQHLHHHPAHSINTADLTSQPQEFEFNTGPVVLQGLNFHA